MWCWLVGVAHAGFWERTPRAGYSVGANLVIGLGPVDDRQRFGFAVDVQYQRFWADLPYYTDEDVERVAPLVTVAAHAGWTHPVVFTEVSAVAGPMWPMQVGDGGFRAGAGAQAGAGVQFGTDGSAGPLLVGAVLGPFVEGRLEATAWHGWHAPRVLVGPTLSLSCCSYFL